MSNYKLYSSSTSTTNSTKIEEEIKKVLGNTDYSKYFVEVDNKTPNYYYPDLKTDEEILDEAKNRVEDLYNTYIDNNKKETEFNINKVNESIKLLDEAYLSRIEDLKKGYEIATDNILNATLKSGMGRSSYKNDLLNTNTLDYNRSTNALNKEKQDKTNQLKGEIDRLNHDMELKTNELEAKRQSEILKIAADLKKDRDKLAFDAQKYNNDLYIKHNQLIMDQQKHNLNVQKYIDSLNTVKKKITTVKTTTTRNTYKLDNSIDKDKINNMWNNMSSNQKVKYFNENQYMLKDKAPELYNSFKGNVETIYGSSLSKYFPHLGIAF